jgi:YHS domain-containing protein
VKARNKITLAMGMSLYILGITIALAQDISLRLQEFNLQDENIAVQGYDVVSYFMGAPQKGNKSLSYEYEDVSYLFGNSDNLDLFKKQPEKFEPVYGGWCAYAMGETGEKVKIDPKTYKIIDGKLYLFYNFYFNNTLIDWNKNEHDLKSRADAYWHEIINKP